MIKLVSTKHIDIKWHQIRDMIKDGDLVVMYIRSEENLADIMMKNTKEALYIKHVMATKKGVLVLSQRNREDVMVVVQWSDGVRWSDVVRRSDVE